MKLGELMLLLSKDESYLVEVSEKDLHTKSGVILAKELKRSKYGDVVSTHLRKKFTVIKPNIKDLLERKVKRAPQIIMPKDAALILALTGVGPGNNVVDAGCGSGFLAIFLAYHVQPGKVFTYEVNPRFIRVAKNNIKLSGLKNIELKEKDITKGIDEKSVDLVTLDLKRPQDVVPHAYKALVPGGWLVVYSPNIEQVIAVRKIIREYEFCQLKTVENIVREWQFKRFSRPKTLGLMHTGWLTFARKIS
jgi:tRNA (adenine57-N1/adenine58-N1)-methyltransferase